MITARTGVDIAVLGIGLGAILYTSFHHAPAPPQIQSEEVKPAQAVRQASRKSIHPDKVMVYSSSVKKDLGLPDNPNEHVISASEVPSSDHPSTVITVIDDRTGESRVILHGEPRPWWDTKRTGEIRLDYGMKSVTGSVTRLSAYEDVIAIKAIHLGVAASIDSDGQVFAGVGLSYRW